LDLASIKHLDSFAARFAAPDFSLFLPIVTVDTVENRHDWSKSLATCVHPIVKSDNRHRYADAQFHGQQASTITPKSLHVEFRGSNAHA
jgi:hypothetical protein